MWNEGYYPSSAPLYTIKYDLPDLQCLFIIKVVVVKSDDLGNIDISDLKAKAQQYKDSLAALMVTYPSTYGTDLTHDLVFYEYISSYIKYLQTHSIFRCI